MPIDRVANFSVGCLKLYSVSLIVLLCSGHKPFMMFLDRKSLYDISCLIQIQVFSMSEMSFLGDTKDSKKKRYFVLPEKKCNKA